MDATTFSSLLRQRLATSGEVTFRAGGLSMLPLIPPGARLHVVRLAADDPRPGRVYLFEHPRGLCAHRLVGATPAGLVFRGDNAPAPETVPAAALLGRVDALVVLGRSVPLSSLLLRAVARTVGASLFLLRRTVPDRWRDRLGGSLRRHLE